MASLLAPATPWLAGQRLSAVADQYLKGEIMTVHQVKAATSELQPKLKLFRKQLHDLFFPALVTKTSLVTRSRFDYSSNKY